ncbi:hypothetical protein SAMN04488029_2809 [Reichenbachiella faecimaris]|uniref:Uncharacterized protein n=1 Tax=Reichenbachiella faecimaris TaxID=692418 RepID=A0A1W2GHZ4_REIFA|nr:hypothetical protein SAMN04488029_2809 [Reichenbachiella faecimaris]
MFDYREKYPFKTVSQLAKKENHNSTINISMNLDFNLIHFRFAPLKK